ncbi:MAG: hypothetical protein M3023_06045 [Pseudomonadota bacterium]|nr:hypothetical protein [Pseudomonadota bacterium]
MNPTRIDRVAGALLVIVLAAACGPSNKPIPADPKARSEFLGTAAAKLKPDERVLLDRFLGRLDNQTAESGKRVEVSVPRAVELQRNFETQVVQARRNLQQLQENAKAVVTIEVRDAKVIRDEKAPPPNDKALRFVINVANRSSRVIENVTLRLEFRDSAGEYQAAIPSLQLNGAIGPGATGRVAQTLPLDPQRQQYILDGKPVQINAFPIRITYAGGEMLEPGKELQAMEALHRAKIE